MLFGKIKILLLFLAMILSVFSYTSDTTLDFRYSLFTVGSDSMNPNISKGSVVLTDSTVEKYEVGDIVTMKYPLNLSVNITHRIVAEEFDDGNYFVSRGDNNTVPDPWQVREDLILGRVIFTIPYLGYLIEFIRSPIGLFIVIILPLSLVIMYELDFIIRRIAKYKEKLDYSIRAIKYKSRMIFGQYFKSIQSFCGMKTMKAP